MNYQIKKAVVVFAAFIIAFNPFIPSSSKKIKDNAIVEKFGVMKNVLSYYRKEVEKPLAIASLPPSFSWLDGGWVTPARFQGNCGSCWDFAAVGALEAIIKIREGMTSLNPDLSEQYILSCLPNAGSCKGGSPYLAYYYIKSTSPEGNYHNGIVTEDCFPYEANDWVPCSHKCSNWEEKLVPIKEYGYWMPDGSNEDRQRIKTQIMEDGPVVSFMDATEDFAKWGLYHHNSTDYYPYKRGTSINHCIVIVGWKDDDSIPHGGYWICKNSWGKYWGYNGFFNIEYGSLNIDSYEIAWVDYDASAYNWPPVAEAGEAYHGSVGEKISFDGSNSCDDGNIIEWHWDFGDGSSANGSRVEHAYNKRGIYTITLEVKDESGKIGIGKTAAFIDAWKEGDEWIYDVKNIEINIADGFSASLNANIEKLDIKMEEGKLGIKGRIKGTFDVNSQPPLQFTGNLFFVTIDGSIKMDENFGFEKVDLNVKGIAMIKFKTFAIPIPLPIKAGIEINFNPTLHIIDFPLEEDKTWNSEICNIDVDGEASALFGLIKYPIKYTLYLGSIEGNCEKKETINVEAGSYEAYKISYYDFLTIYYSPEISNIVKAEASFENNTFYAELKEVNYE